MEELYYIGLDIRKRSACISPRQDRRDTAGAEWARAIQSFTGWIYELPAHRRRRSLLRYRK